MINDNERKSHGRVSTQFMDRVERYQKAKFQCVGKFDLNHLRDLIEQAEEEERYGDVEVFVLANNKMRDGTTSGLIVVKCNSDDYFALAGMTDP